MSWTSILNAIARIAHSFVNIASVTYDMIIGNQLILAFVLVCVAFVGAGLLKRLLDI